MKNKSARDFKCLRSSIRQSFSPSFTTKQPRKGQLNKEPLQLAVHPF
jgi:hypothetical protein